MQLGASEAELLDLRENLQQQPLAMLTLNESKFNPFMYEACSECAICMDTFENGQLVTALPCDERHYFHSKCILAWS